MPCETAAGWCRESAVMAVDVSHQVMGYETFPVTGGYRVREHAALVDGIGVGHHEDHLVSAAFRHRLIGHGGHGSVCAQKARLQAGAEPAFIGVGVAMEQVNHRIAAVV